jgi:hypothetical protein
MMSCQIESETSGKCLQILLFEVCTQQNEFPPHLQGGGGVGRS